MVNVEKSYQDTTVLKGVSFGIEAGERVSLIGTGGCGKTTILKLILGLLPPDAGVIEVMQTQASDSAWGNVLKKVGVAFQQGGLFDFMTVEQNLLFAMHRMTAFSRSEMEAKIAHLLDKIELKGKGELFPHELSGGMQRRVGIARALSTDPVVAIFDEPTSGLDPVTSTTILNTIKELQADSRRVLLIATTSVETALRFAERIIMIRDGKIVADGSWREIMRSKDSKETKWVKNFLLMRLPDEFSL